MDSNFSSGAALNAFWLISHTPHVIYFGLVEMCRLFFRHYKILQRSQPTRGGTVLQPELRRNRDQPIS